MKLGFLGPEGTYTEEAARLAGGSQATLQAFPSIDAVFAAVARQEVDRGLVPIENVIHGPVTETLDNLYSHAAAVKIADMLVLPISHAIGCLDPARPVTRILSKDQALKQCSRYLQRHFPAAEQVAVASTGAAMQTIVDGRLLDAAAIGSVAALQHYGLQVLAESIGNVPHNKTRFAVLAGARTPYHPRTGSDATALVIYPHRDRIGLLQDILTVVSKEHGLSCSSIHSRPDTHGAFRFYIEMEGHADDETVRACLEALAQRLEGADVEIRVFGAYPRRAFNEPRIRTIGIIGGTGQMGGWFDRFLTGAGYKVLLSGRRTALTYAACIAQSDVVLINVPIKDTVAVIRQVGPHFRPGQLIADNTSIKTQPVAAMLAAVHKGVEVLGMHTVFGPNVDALRGQNIVFTRTDASGELAREFEDIFYKYGARITHTTPEHHDKQMAFHQNLEHFTKVVLAEVLRTTFADPREADLYSSPNSRTSLITMGRVLSADPELYAEIQSHNLQGGAMLTAYMAVAESLYQAIRAGDLEAFTSSMATSATQLGEEYLQELVRRSKALMKNLI